MYRHMNFLIFFVIIQLFLVFFQIHKNSTVVRYSYLKQRNEKLLDTLIEEKDSLTHRLQTLKSSAVIKENAQRKGMTPLRLDRIKRIEDLNDKSVQSQA